MTMKRILSLILFSLCITSAMAQKDLKIAIYFSEPYLAIEGVSAVQIEGDDLIPYNLSLFRSITLTPESTPDASRKLMEQRVMEDGKLATKKEVAMIGGRLYYGFYVLPPKNKKTNRYIFYRNNKLKPEAKPQEIKLVYIEGAASPAELKKIFK